MSGRLVLREAKRPCYCRGCEEELGVGTMILHTSTYTNRGGNIIFCMDCVRYIKDLYNSIYVYGIGRDE